MQFYLQLATFCKGTNKLQREYTIQYDPVKHEALVAHSDDDWHVRYVVELPRDAVFTQNSLPKSSIFLKFPHKRYPEWWDLQKQLCLTAANGDVACVKELLSAIPDVCMDQSAFALLPKLPEDVCHNIGMISGGTQGACNTALHYCLNRPVILEALLAHGDVSRDYVHQNKGQLFLTEHDLGDASDDFHEIESRVVRGFFLNKVLVSTFGLTPDLDGVLYCSPGWRPIAF